MGHKQQLLLDRPLSSNTDDESEVSRDDGVVFAEDTPHSDSDVNRQVISRRKLFEDSTSNVATIESLPMSNTSDVFADGESRLSGTGKKRDGVDTGGHTLYIQMSLYPVTLAQYISPPSKGRGLPRHCFHLVPSLQLLSAIHSGLRYIHAKGFIHRDIKPSAVLLDSPDGPAYLSDFGTTWHPDFSSSSEPCNE